jgi:3-oxoacyl-[acyl-carrier-protein] synthase-1
MCTSLGDAVTACAAARAGISRPGDLNIPGWAPEEGEKPATGHAVPHLTGFQGGARLINLAWRALGDLLGRNDIRTSADQVGFFLCLPDLLERRISDEEDDETDDQEPAEKRAADRQQATQQEQERAALCDRVLSLAGLAIPPLNRRTIVAGRVGFAVALREALVALERRSLQACLVGAADTLVDQAALAWLAESGRLKGPETPAGLQPGEAGVFVLLEQPESIRRRNGSSQATLVGVATAQGEDEAKLNRPPRGSAILTAVSEVMGAAHGGPPRDLWWLSDQNGESDRALEWGDFLIRFSGRFPACGPAPHWYPAVSFGDTGAAAPAIATCIAARAFTRRYAPARAALVVSSSEGGLRGAIGMTEPA